MSFKVLLVDDEPGIRKVLKIYLEDAGYEVITADDGLKASGLVLSEAPDIVLTDIKMPGKSGMDLLKFIKSEDLDTEVIMITGHGDMKLAMESLKMDAVDFITKPIDNDILDIALKRASDRLTAARTIQKYTRDLEGLVEEKTRKLAASEQKYIRLFNESPSYITTQNRSYDIIESNDMFRRHFDLKAGSKCYEAYKNLDHPCPNCPVKKSFDDGKPHTAEMNVTLNNGRNRNIFIQTSPMAGPTGEIEQVMEMSTDITVIRQLQDHLASLGLHIASVSHGMKGVLTGLDGGAYLIDSGLKKQDVNQVQEGWDIVKEKISKTKKMVLDILFHSKDRALNLKRVSVNKFVTELGSSIRTSLEDTPIEFDLIEAQPDFNISIDKGILYTAILGVLENSVDACKDMLARKNDLTIRFKVEQRDREAVFSIWDNAKGLSRESQENIFTLFYSDKGSKGTGLGLFIAERSVQKHNGRIRVSSEENKFTHFTIHIPIEGA
jgi:signal transduction histidine kinase/DNA-binding response OmpR family regulator